jgi:hypothetical protein
MKNENEKRFTEALEKLVSAAEKEAKVTDSLRRAACRVAAMVEERVPAGIWLPWDYEVVDSAIEGGFRAKFLVKHHEGDGEFFVDSNDKDNPTWIPAQTRAGVMEFAQDIRDGWLDELAEFLKKRAQKAQAALSIVNDTSF